MNVMNDNIVQMFEKWLHKADTQCLSILNALEKDGLIVVKRGKPRLAVHEHSNKIELVYDITVEPRDKELLSRLRKERDEAVALLDKVCDLRKELK